MTHRFIAISLSLVTLAACNPQTPGGNNGSSASSTSTERPLAQQGEFCGGIAAFQCAAGLTCKYDGEYPDAGGTCIAAEWKDYKHADLGFTIAYPSTYVITLENGGSVEMMTGAAIAIEGMHFGDQMPEGQGVHIYRTTDERILEHLKADMPLKEAQTRNGIEFQAFYRLGMGETYGYVTKHDKYYYVIDSMWGPANPVTEKMVDSFRFSE